MKCETGVWKTAAFALWWSKTTTVHWHRSGERHQITTYHSQYSELMLTHPDKGNGEGVGGGSPVFKTELPVSQVRYNFLTGTCLKPAYQKSSNVILSVSQFGLVVRHYADKQKDLGLISLSLSPKVVACKLSLVTLSLTINETLNWPSSLPM